MKEEKVSMLDLASALLLRTVASSAPVHRLFSTNYPIYSLTFNMTYNAAICFVVSQEKRFTLKVHAKIGQSRVYTQTRCKKFSR